MIYQGLFGMEAGVLTRLPRADSNATRESAIAWSDACPRLIAAATRISAIEKMEKAKGIKRDHKQLHGKKTCIVYMSKEDKKSKIFKTLEETVEARAEKIGFPRRCARKRTARCGLAAESLSAVSAAVPNLCSVLVKVDAAYRARKEWDHAIKELHNEETRLIPQSQAGGAERRVGADGNSYTRQEFEEYYRGQRGVSWEAKWAAAKPIAGASAQGGMYELVLPECNAFLRKALFELLQHQYPELTAESRALPEAPEWKKQLVIVRLSADERAVRKAERRAAKLEKLRERAGFLRVWRLLTAARKPIVGHNLTYDLLFLLSHFHRSPLPSTLAEFKATVHELFPQVWDTKLVAMQSGRYADTMLAKLHEALVSSAGVSAVPLAAGFEAYEGAERCHEAGYDAYLTGVAHAALVQLGHATAGRCNLCYMMRSLSILNLDPAGEDPSTESGTAVRVAAARSMAACSTAARAVAVCSAAVLFAAARSSTAHSAAALYPSYVVARDCGRGWWGRAECSWFLSLVYMWYEGWMVGER